MANVELGPIFAEIGQLLAADLRTDPDGGFMYAEAGEGWIEPSLFKDVGNRIIYREPSNALSDKLLQAWEAEEPDKRWAALRYEIASGRFTVSFIYPDELNAEESSFERSERVLKEKFGDKPVDYSDP